MTRNKILEASFPYSLSSACVRSLSACDFSEKFEKRTKRKKEKKKNTLRRYSVSTTVRYQSVSFPLSLFFFFFNSQSSPFNLCFFSFLVLLWLLPYAVNSYANFSFLKGKKRETIDIRVHNYLVSTVVWCQGFASDQPCAVRQWCCSI